jgi:hypothetical protein
MEKADERMELISATLAIPGGDFWPNQLHYPRPIDKAVTKILSWEVV